ncbi:MAG: menaquinone biosynthesis protein [Pirellulaceae bacterium]
MNKPGNQRHAPSRADTTVSNGSPSPIRVGAVSYLNTRPLVYGIEAYDSQIHVDFDLPSRLADRLHEGHYDVALIPSIEYFQHPDYKIVSDACIACRGPVMSVKVVFRCPPESVRSLGVDEGSRTSAALARVLLNERYGLRPELVPFPIGSQLSDVVADAVLTIGDRAIHLPREDFYEIWDLGQEWVDWCGLPFVFAMWVARSGVDTSLLEPILSATRDAGLANLDQIVATEAPRHDLSIVDCQRYFSEHLHFVLGQRENDGLQLFQQHAQRLGISPARWVEQSTGRVRLVDVGRK